MVTYCKHCIILRNISFHNAKSVVDKPYHVISVCLAVCKHMAIIYVTFPPYEHRLPISTRPSAVFAVDSIIDMSVWPHTNKSPANMMIYFIRLLYFVQISLRFCIGVMDCVCYNLFINNKEVIHHTYFNGRSAKPNAPRLIFVEPILLHELAFSTFYCNEYDANITS